MSHADDGTLNALLDGELDAAEAEAVRSHIATCPECAKRLEDARRFLASAADLLGALELPASLATPPAPVRRVPKTAKEVAINLDGATQKSPAIRPNLPEAAPPPQPRRPFDFSTLAWAATIVLAIGVGFLANEVRHEQALKGAGQEGEGGVAQPVAAPPQTAQPAGNEPARATRTERAAARRAPTATRTAAGDANAARARNASGALALKTAAPPSAGGKQLAGAHDAAAGRPATQLPARTEVAGVAGVETRPRAPTRAPTAPAARAPSEGAGLEAAPARAQRAELDIAGPRNAPGAAGRGASLAVFRRATLEEAVARLGGAIRLVDGMQFEEVDVGPGRLVPGADRNRDLVRVVYFDEAGRRLELDQQRVAPPPLAGEPVSPDIGMRDGDTLTTAAPGGEVRVRWIDGTFWLSLKGSLPPDSLRRLVERVR